MANHNVPMKTTIWQFNIAIEHGPFILGFAMKIYDFPVRKLWSFTKNYRSRFCDKSSLSSSLPLFKHIPFPIQTHSNYRNYQSIHCFTLKNTSDSRPPFMGTSEKSWEALKIFPSEKSTEPRLCNSSASIKASLSFRSSFRSRAA